MPEEEVEAVEEQEDVDDDEGDTRGPGQASGSERFESGRIELQRLVGEYKNLDFEDDIDGIRTRFRYKPVSKDDYGLDPVDILLMSDKDLNRLVGLKRLAPYREDGGKLHPKKLKAVKYQAREILQERQQQGTKPRGNRPPQPQQARHGKSEAEEAENPELRKKRRLESYAKPALHHGPEEEGKKKKKEQPQQKKQGKLLCSRR